MIRAMNTSRTSTSVRTILFSFSAPLMLSIIVLVLAVPTYGQNAHMTKGAKVYNEYCKTCHQSNGQGLGAVFPPLAKSDYLTSKSKDVIIKEVVEGKSGKVKVNGKDYNGVMAPLPAKYSADDVAAVLTYVYNSFGNKGGTVTVADVRKVVPKRK